MAKIALLQMVSSQQPEQNLARLKEMVTEAAAGGAQTLFLPENFAAFANPDTVAIGLREATATASIQSFVSELALTHGVWIFAGTVPLATQPDGSPVAAPRVRAASLVFDDTGKLKARYDKVHMFDVMVDDNHGRYTESSTFEPGTDLVLVDSPCGRIGLTVCYDIRFPVMYERLFKAGATAFAIPSAFTRTTGQAHFRILMQARAVEHFCYCIAACQGGVHDSGRETWGHSMVVGPWGEVLAEAGSGEAILYAEVDVAQVLEARRNIPVGQQSRSGIDL